MLKHGTVDAVDQVLDDLREHSEESVKEEKPWNG